MGKSIYSKSGIYKDNFKRYHKRLIENEFSRAKIKKGKYTSDKGLAFFVGAPILEKEEYDTIVAPFAELPEEKIVLPLKYLHSVIFETIKCAKSYDIEITSQVLEQQISLCKQFLDELKFNTFHLKAKELKLAGDALILVWIPVKNKKEIFRLRKKFFNWAKNESNIITTRTQTGQPVVNDAIHTTLIYFKGMSEESQEEIEKLIRQFNRDMPHITYKVDEIGLWTDTMNVEKLEKTLDFDKYFSYERLSEKKAMK